MRMATRASSFSDVSCDKRDRELRDGGLTDLPEVCGPGGVEKETVLSSIPSSPSAMLP